MSDYDAFGRKKDEAGLGDLGWGSSGDASATTNPVPASDEGYSAPAEFTSVPSGPPPAPRRRRSNPAVWLVQLIVLGAVAFAIYAVVDAGRDTVNDVRGAIDDINGTFNGGGSGGGNGGDDTVPEQLKPRNLFATGGLREALRIMERENPGRIVNFSIRRDSISAQVVSGRKREIISFNADAEVPEVITTVSPGVMSGSFSYEEVNATAPQRLMKAANQRLGRSPADVEYFIVSRSGDAMQWGIYYEGGSPIALGDSRGRYTRRIS